MQLIKDLLKLAVYSVLLQLVWMLLTGCQRVVPYKESHTIERRDSLVYLPGASVEKTVYLDSTTAWPIEQWQRHTDSLHRAELRYMRDRFGRLHLQANCPPDTIRVQNTRETRIVEKVLEKTKTPIWAWLLIGALCALVLGLAVRR